MEAGLKEKIVMHALYPKRLASSDPAMLRHLLFYACLFELSERGIFSSDGKKFFCKESTTGQDVPDMIIQSLMPFSGKSLSRLAMIELKVSGKVLSCQLKNMTKANLLHAEEIRLFSWKIGVRYRVRKHDKLKPGIRDMERVLLYGRQADTEILFLVVLLKEGKLFNNVFSVDEYREICKARAAKLLKSDLFRQCPTWEVIHKMLKKSLNVQGSSKSSNLTSLT